MLSKYFKEGKIGKGIAEARRLEKGLRIHSEGIMPEELIGEQRPSEPIEVMKYRKKLFQPVTKETVSRIITCLSKIRRSSDWAVMWDVNTFPASIKPDETPDEYFDNHFPYFRSLTNWLFSVCLKNYLIDANGICVVMPLEFVVPENQYLKPFPFIFNSSHVMDYVENDYCVIESIDKASYKTESGATRNDGKRFWVIDTVSIIRYDQINEKGDIAATITFKHGLGYMPAFRLGGIYLKSIDQVPIWESRINSIVPQLNKAAREDNDLDISVVRHLFPEKWEYVSAECPTCKGVGKITTSSGNETCKSCNGFGRTVSSPMQSHLIFPAGLNEQQAPTPPAGYITKDIEIIKVQSARIDEHLYKALAAINMEFLAKTPLSQSGVAKEVDRDELNNFVYSIAEDLVAIMDRIYYIGIDYRYMVLVPVDKERRAMCPKVNVPEKYDLLSTNYLIQEYATAKTAKMNPVLINKMEQEIATKKFSTDPDMKDELMAILTLDPFAGLATEDKMAAIQNNFITKTDAVISSNIVAYVRRARFENADFYTWQLDKQQALMEKYAGEDIAEMDEASKMKMKMFSLPPAAPPASEGDANAA